MWDTMPHFTQNEWENHENIKPYRPVSRPRFEPWTPKIQSRVLHTWPQCLIQMGNKETEKLCAVDISVKCLNTQNDLQQNLSPYQAPGCYLVKSQFFGSCEREHHIVTSSLNTCRNWRMKYTWSCAAAWNAGCNEQIFTQKPYDRRNKTQNRCNKSDSWGRGTRNWVKIHAQLQRHRLKFIKNHLKNSYMFRSTTIFRELQCPR